MQQVSVLLACALPALLVGCPLTLHDDFHIVSDGGRLDAADAMLTDSARSQDAGLDGDGSPSPGDGRADSGAVDSAGESGSLDSGAAETALNDAPSTEGSSNESGPCGALGEACCSGTACNSNLLCNGTCQACGAVGEACCGGSACSSGTCTGGTCQASGSDACTPVIHSNGSGQSWMDCVPLDTYNETQATRACEAYIGTASGPVCLMINCGGDVAMNTVVGSMSLTWDYQGTYAGHVAIYSGAAAVCPMASDPGPTWN